MFQLLNRAGSRDASNGYFMKKDLLLKLSLGMAGQTTSRQQR